jgi:hypothetical protein
MSGGGCATSRREAAQPKNEARIRRLKTHPSSLEHEKEWRNAQCCSPLIKKRAFTCRAPRSIQRIWLHTRSKARHVVDGSIRLAPPREKQKATHRRGLAPCFFLLCFFLTPLVPCFLFISHSLAKMVPTSLGAHELAWPCTTPARNALFRGCSVGLSRGVLGACSGGSGWFRVQHIYEDQSTEKNGLADPLAA